MALSRLGKLSNKEKKLKYFFLPNWGEGGYPRTKLGQKLNYFHFFSFEDFLPYIPCETVGLDT